MDIKELSALGPRGQFTYGNDNDLTNFLVRIKATIADASAITDFLRKNFTYGDIVGWRISNSSFGKSLPIGDLYINFNKS